MKPMKLHGCMYLECNSARDAEMFLVIVYRQRPHISCRRWTFENVGQCQPQLLGRLLFYNRVGKKSFLIVLFVCLFVFVQEASFDAFGALRS